MAFLDDVLAEVQASKHLPESLKTVASQFLSTNRDLLERIGPALLHDVFAELLDGHPGQAWGTLVNSMSENELITLLESTNKNMDPQLASRAQAAAAFTQFKASMGEAALSIVMHVLLAVL